jgi:hypothetical protein
MFAGVGLYISRRMGMAHVYEPKQEWALLLHYGGWS